MDIKLYACMEDCTSCRRGSNVFVVCMVKGFQPIMLFVKAPRDVNKPKTINWHMSMHCVCACMHAHAHARVCVQTVHVCTCMCTCVCTFVCMCV